MIVKRDWVDDGVWVVDARDTKNKWGEVGSLKVKGSRERSRSLH